MIKGLKVFEFARVRRIGRTSRVLVVHSRQALPVGSTIGKATRCNSDRLDAEMARNREVPKEPLARFNARRSRSQNIGEAPNRHVTPISLDRRKEVPIAH